MITGAIDRKRKLKQDFLKDKAARDQKVAALPKVFQERIKGFWKRKPDFRWEHEPYEVFCCEEAVKIKNRLNTIEEVALFHDASIEKQKEMIPEVVYDQHSGNTFGFSCVLARLLIENNDEVTIKYHGALCPLVGCEEYGCWAGSEEAKKGKEIK